ncbi:MAG TPA: MFS transporter [Beijerinckiaceae bacterium]|jgi:MFS family permease
MMQPIASDDTLARRNALVLAGAQALGGANPAIVVSLGGLVGQALAENDAYATLPVSVFNLGLAIGTLPAAALMRRFGRRNGYLVGAAIGAVGSSIAAVAITLGAFVLFCLGTFVAGFYASHVQSYRFAAADSASPAFRPRAISWVMTGGLAAALIGPTAANLARDLVPGAQFAGSFITQGALALVSVLVLMNLRAPPPPPTASSGGRPLGVILSQPRFIVAVAAGLTSYGLMSFVMTAAPVAMVGCGHPVGTATLGISAHIVAMYGPSFFTGGLIARFGKERITALGLVLIAAAAVVGLAGLTVAHFWTALVLLGIGWNFGYIGATALVTDCYAPEERTRVQAANDFLVFGSVAIASFSSGRLLSAGGWTGVNWTVFPLVATALALLAWQVWRGEGVRVA